MHALRLCASDPRIAAFGDDTFFHLSKTGHHVKYHFSGWRAEIEPLPEADDFRAFICQRLDRCQHVNGIATEAVNCNHHEYIPLIANALIAERRRTKALEDALRAHGLID